MYTKAGTIQASKYDFSNYIEGYDVYNSKIIELAKEHEDEKVDYLITTMDYRPDLIAQELYGDTKFVAFLMISTALGLEGYKKGTTIRVLPRGVFDEIINSL